MARKSDQQRYNEALFYQLHDRECKYCHKVTSGPNKGTYKFLFNGTADTCPDCKRRMTRIKNQRGVVAAFNEMYDYEQKSVINRFLGGRHARYVGPKREPKR